MRKSTTLHTTRQPLWQRLMPIGMALAATLLAAPGHAVTIPNLPLQTGSAYPPPNIMFILDDSGSMTWRYMYNTTISSISGGGVTSVPTGDNRNGDSAYGTSSTNAEAIYDQTAVTNTIYYNPAVTYRPWIKADDTRETGGTSYTAAFGDANALTGVTDLSSATRIFYAPKPGATNLGDRASYYRYQIVNNASVINVVRSELGTVTSTTTTAAGFPLTGLSALAGGMGPAVPIVVPANATQLVVTTSGGSHGSNAAATNNNGDGADLYVRFGSAPTTSTFDCESTNGNNNETCTINNPQAGTWYAALDRESNYINVTLTATYASNNRCGTGTGSTDFINCTSATPTGRSAAAEAINFATWFSYHRTRMKVAKAGGSEAFSQLGTSVRVGYDSIWNRSPFNIPVATNDGVFTGANRSTWFERLQAAAGSNGTPLKGALQRTGQYFENTTASGPWGPSSGADQISCRQNFAILTTDGYWNSDAGYNAPVGDADATAGTQITSKDGNTNYTYAPARPYTDNFLTTPSTRPDTLADVAMHYWKRDLRPTLDNDVPDSLADPAFWQHMVTFGVSIGLQGLLNPQADLPSITNGSKRWGDPIDAEDAERIDDLWHASVNGRGEFVTAGNTQQFAQGLTDALATVASRLGSASNVTANSTSFQADSRIYQASYVSGVWTGELAAYNVSNAGIAAVPAWEASKRIPATRSILTWNLTGGATFPTAAQTTALDQSLRPLSPVSGAQNAAYIRGTATMERRNGGTLRSRDTVLGDIANSSPAFVKDNQTIFVGANDGMLHAFAAVDRGPDPSDIKGGTELFAYVPRGINLADLATLSDPRYSHRFFVDGPVVVSSRAQTPGKNYLVGALGRGGKGLFGLDVTTPDSFGTADVLWDNTGTFAPANMGHVLGDPLVVTLNNGTKGVVVSNGVNSTTGTASLFVINIATGAVVRELNTLVTGDNGLSAPRGADLDGNGTVDYVYAGDLKGNLWKFDLSGATAASWSIANGGSPMFVAQNSAGVRQPITTSVALARNPSNNKLWVFIGTGSFMSDTDVANNDVQSMYGLIDDSTVISGRTDLVERQILITTLANGRSVRGFEPHATALAAGRKGWYIDLDDPEAGERIVSPPRVRGSVLLTASLIPPSAGECDSGGTGFINAIDVFTGTSLAQPYFDTNGDGNFNDSDKVAVGGQNVPVGSIGTTAMPTLPVMIGKRLFWGESDGGRNDENVNPQGGQARRISWHEVVGE